MSSFFVVPSFAPPTLEQLATEPDEVAIIVAQEAKITQELAQVREYNKNAEPLGVIAAHEELESEQEEGLTSDEGGAELTEEEEEEVDEEEGDTDIEDGDGDAM
ncbi:expressed protein [Chlorella variabilis]|uniref:Expressed protein n=1 Tax=Chlorella variabilis TaxID=554065 RepID=E1ZBA1_CHLVA|nr:expressed protein [Chlorella variabilis]EFN56820.1 expressed protein [Chlorella variabilis]|eukprot:XP_005848922.1 expressed protein [Chlorella variabilis]